MFMALVLAACGNSFGTAQPAAQSKDKSEVSSQQEYSSNTQRTPNKDMGNASSSETGQASQINNPRILVAYFSRADENYGVGFVEKGNTEIIAEMIANETGADTFKIERAVPYPADYDECTDVSGKEHRDNARPTLKNTLDNLDGYDVIYLGMPIWWGDMPMPVYTFVEGLDWHGKLICPFTTHAGSGLYSVPRTLSRICDGAMIGDGFTIAGTTAQNNQDKARKAVVEWIRSSNK